MSDTLTSDSLLAMVRAFRHPMGGSLDAHFGGLRIIESAHLTIGPFEDWSRVRSPGRARRRRSRHRQNIRFYHLPDPKMYRTGEMLVGHPATVAQLRAGLRVNPFPTAPKERDS